MTTSIVRLQGIPQQLDYDFSNGRTLPEQAARYQPCKARKQKCFACFQLTSQIPFEGPSNGSQKPLKGFSRDTLKISINL